MKWRGETEAIGENMSVERRPNQYLEITGHGYKWTGCSHQGAGHLVSDFWGKVERELYLSSFSLGGKEEVFRKIIKSQIFLKR